MKHFQKGSPQKGEQRIAKVAQATFASFARVCVHGHGAHLPLEKCKNRRTGRRFLRMNEGQGKWFPSIEQVF